MQKVIPWSVFLTTPRSVRALLSQLLIAGAGANVRSDLCEEKGARASIVLGVNFYTFVMYLTAGAAPLLTWIAGSVALLSTELRDAPNFSCVLVLMFSLARYHCFMGDPQSSWSEFLLCFIKFKVIFHSCTLPSLGMSMGFLLLELDPIYSSPWVCKGYSLAFPLSVFL